MEIRANFLSKPNILLSSLSLYTLHYPPKPCQFREEAPAVTICPTVVISTPLCRPSTPLPLYRKDNSGISIWALQYMALKSVWRGARLLRYFHRSRKGAPPLSYGKHHAIDTRTHMLSHKQYVSAWRLQSWLRTQWAISVGSHWICRTQWLPWVEWVRR